MGPGGPSGDFEMPSGHDGTWETVTVAGRSCLRPTESAYYLYAVLPDGFKRRATAGLWVEVEYSRQRVRTVPPAVRLERPHGRRAGALQGGDPALAARSGGAHALPAGRLPAARLRQRPRAEPRRVLPPRVPARAPDHEGRGEPRSPARPRELPGHGARARAQEAAGTLLPDQLPVRRDHERLQLQVHLVPGRDHGPKARLHEEGARLPAGRRDRAEALVPRADLPREAAPDGRADAASGAAGDRGLRGRARRPDRAQHQLRPDHRGARRGSLPRRAHEPDPVLPDPRPRDLQDAQGAEARVRRVPRQGAPRRSSARWRSARARTSRSTS